MEKHKKFKLFEEGDMGIIARESEKKCIVLLLTASWLGSSYIVEPLLAEEGSKYPEVELYKVDIEENQELADKLDIRQLPTTFFFVDGEITGFLQGLVNRTKVRMKYMEATDKLTD